jgi:DNA-binding CsgD family transcriptional regulator
MKPDPVELVENLYDCQAQDGEWLQRLVRGVIAQVPEAQNGYCYRIDASSESEPRIVGVPVSISLPDGFQGEFKCFVDSYPVSLEASREFRRLHCSPRKVSTISDQLGRGAMASSSHATFVRAYGSQDAFGCVALDAECRGIVIAAGLPRITSLPRRVRSLWSVLGAHVATANRMRFRSQRNDECVLAPDGRAVHAEGDATAIGARERLRDAVVKRDRARTRQVRSKPQEALALWPAMVSARWSLMDRFERDGRRYVVARRNEPLPPGPLALTVRERQICRHMVQGDSVKLTAYTLGLAPSTVSAVARSVLLKLGVRTVSQLAALDTPRGAAPNSDAAWPSEARG